VQQGKKGKERREGRKNKGKKHETPPFSLEILLFSKNPQRLYFSLSLFSFSLLSSFLFLSSLFSLLSLLSLLSLVFFPFFRPLFLFKSLQYLLGPAEAS